MAIRILANGRLVLVLCVFAVSALWHWPASAQPTENTAGKPQSTVSENLDEEQRSLDKRKTKAEIAKLQVEWWTAGIAPVLSAASVLLLAITLITQRQTQIDIQEHQGKTQIDIQERQGKNQIDIQKRQEKLDFELKSAELILNSRNPAMADGRAELLMNLYPERIDPQFKATIDKYDFPGVLGQEMRMEVFKQLASKYANPKDVAKIFFMVYPWERKQMAKWFEIDDIPAPCPVDSPPKPDSA